MFFNKIKDFIVKKIVKKSVSNVNHSASTSCIKTVGIVFDESYFYEKEELIKDLVTNGIDEKNISILVFKNKIRKNELLDDPFFSYSDLNWNATFDKDDVLAFVDQNFDLLINYYDVEKSALVLLTHLSKAHFKVGFASVDKKLNHFIIDTNAENYKVFIEELFKYLKILNKI